MRKTTTLTAAFLLFAIFTLSAHAAKTRMAGENNGAGLARTAVNADAADVSSLSSAEIENRFRPYFEERAQNRRDDNRRGPGGKRTGQRRSTANVKNIIRPTSKDLLTLMHKWNDLTPEFRALYAEATAIPAGRETYISPSGHFKIFYMTSGIDSVDVTDTIGYAADGQPSSWRERSRSPNGVPDYVDEVAFALDSSWSMIIDRFGFPKPLTTPGPGGEAGYYNVLIALLYEEEYDDFFYGVTYPQAGSVTSSTGFPSHIEINSDWSDPLFWGSLGYDKRPIDAVRVTAAHEFFHAPQYTMARHVYLYNFPTGWLEGSAVLMEELAFPEINDYLQYIGEYFRTPTRVTLLDDYDYVYLNGILFKYLYEKVNAVDSIGLIKSAFFYNRDNSMPQFHRTIENVTQAYAKKSWAETLNAFHAESYFTRQRARRPHTFISDAELMDSWRAPTDTAAASVTRSVRRQSLELLRYVPRAEHSDTLVLNISGVRDASITGKTWAATALIMERGSDSVDIAPIPLDQSGSGRFILPNWKEKSACLLVVTNASFQSSRNITVKTGSTSDPPVEPPKETPLTILPNVVRLGGGAPEIRISGDGITNIKIFTQDGKLLGRYNWSAYGNAVFQVDGPTVVWRPNRRIAPGVYFISAESVNPATNKKSRQKRKVIIMP
ncbi:MAG: hypothetical protein FWB94_03030 [Chitinispirillia bacterium]|nr:hypothetical protein [Chitinispirillia bacterium]